MGLAISKGGVECNRLRWIDAQGLPDGPGEGTEEGFNDPCAWGSAQEVLGECLGEVLGEVMKC